MLNTKRLILLWQFIVDGDFWVTLNHLYKKWFPLLCTQYIVEWVKWLLVSVYWLLICDTLTELNVLNHDPTELKHELFLLVDWSVWTLVECFTWKRTWRKNWSQWSGFFGSFQINFIKIQQKEQTELMSIKVV